MMDLLELLEAKDQVLATQDAFYSDDQMMWQRHTAGLISGAELHVWRDDHARSTGYLDVYPERASSPDYTRLCRARIAYDCDPSPDTRDLLATLIDLRNAHWWAARGWPLDGAPRHVHELGPPRGPGDFISPIPRRRSNP